ncbi:unnamed protein product [Thlaspi arvense]|uniref:X8 domain-containing protein n=1 Tax=Thlaspi arvense TaxID=13288 RepID=A0AAU9S7U8_THLAR|nr:unnamed protein product [Thlaspi arvense]
MKINADAISDGYVCVADRYTTDNEKLLRIIDFICSKMDCTIIKPGGICYEPDTPLSHASFVMNRYYQAQGRHKEDCDFEGAGYLTDIDPSYGGCRY